MSSSSKNCDLKEINAYKKKLTWGDIPAIYQMVSNSVGDLDGILTHGFDSGYKRLLNKNNWNLDFLGSFKDDNNEVQIKTKAQISLCHFYGEMGYELHCFPIVNGEPLNSVLVNNPQSPFLQWLPENMRMLFRINSFVAYAVFSYQNGDDADMELIKHAFIRVNELIEILNESFDIIEVKGLSIAEFYREIHCRNGDILTTSL